jgi:hypothetical protein
MDIPDTTPPNGPLSYTHTETRTGPSLTYVAEKLRTSIMALHSLHTLALIDLPDDLPCPERHRIEWPAYNPKDDSVLASCYSAFRAAIVSYLALNNMLAMANDNDIFERLLEMRSDEFTRWLDNITREGSVT